MMPQGRAGERDRESSLADPVSLHPCLWAASRKRRSMDTTRTFSYELVMMIVSLRATSALARTSSRRGKRMDR
jgi:hypothetical protein